MDKLQKFEEIAKILDKDQPTTDEVAVAIETVLEAVIAIREHLEKSILQTEIGYSEKVEEVTKKFDSLKETLAEQLKSINLIHTQGRRTLSKEISGLVSEIRRVESLIPEVKDWGHLAEEIRKVEQKIKELPGRLTGDEIIDEINSENTQGKIKRERIEGWDEIMRLIKTRNAPVSGGIIGRDFIKDIDLSDDLDGVTKTFNIQAVWNIISVNLSSYPYGSLRKGIDYTWTPTSITFTDEIVADAQLAEGQKCILTVVTA